MRLDIRESHRTDSGARVVIGDLSFSNPVLADYRWPVFEIEGSHASPRLCVSAGVHVNEVSSIEAAIRLQREFASRPVFGSVSIIPLVNLPAQYRYTEYLCPVDGKNINFSFPGRPDGSFTEALCHAIQYEWCKDADCYIDLHGGDLRENVSKFSMFQRTGDADGDEFRKRLACAFDADLVVGFEPSLMQSPGRPPTGFARDGRVSIMSEAGANGVPDAESIDFHLSGVLNVARSLGILRDGHRFSRRKGIVCRDYVWVGSPASGLFYPEVHPGEPVDRGQCLGQMRDLFHRGLAAVVAPVGGFILWRLTHPMVEAEVPLLAIAVPEADA
jgi:hypothetical protein